jgi:lincosamide nucleotidyltransferase A/C/D/E
MTAADVLEVLDRLEAAGIETCLDGGWGVDALLGRETRRHRDLDVVVRRVDADIVQRALAPLGFVHAADARPGLPSRVVLRDGRARQVDLHPVAVDTNGDAWQNLGGRFGRYPATGLGGEGMIDGRKVRCLTPELQVAHHRGYELPEHERGDLELLAERFALQ